eukprot:2468045-Amphidinium_carterae.1
MYMCSFASSMLVLRHCWCRKGSKAIFACWKSSIRPALDLGCECDGCCQAVDVDLPYQKESKSDPDY